MKGINNKTKPDNAAVFPFCPEQVTITAGARTDELFFNWLTAPPFTDTRVRYRPTDIDSWTYAEGHNALHRHGDNPPLRSHKAKLCGLCPSATYVYEIGSAQNGGACWADPSIFIALPADSAPVSLACFCDLQPKLSPYTQALPATMRYMLANQQKPDLLLFTGDFIRHGSCNQDWADFFSAMEPYSRSYPAIFMPGNHEQKMDDPFYTQFAARFFMHNGFPDTFDGVSIEHITGWFEAGDACIVVIATVLSPDHLTDAFIKAQLDWAERIFTRSKKKWRILASHAGPYLIHKDGSRYRPLLNEGCDRLGVDLYLDGHDHMYMRGTVRHNTKAAPGQGTTYITGGVMGWDIFDRYEQANDPYVDAHNDARRLMFKRILISTERLSVAVYQNHSKIQDDFLKIDFTNWALVDELHIPHSLSE